MVHGLKYAEPSTAVSCQLNLIKHLIHNAQHTLVNVYSTVSNCDLDVDTKSGQETCNQLSHRRPSRSPRRGVARVWFCWYIRSLREAEFILTTQAFFHRFLACAFSFFDLTN